jgi:lysophospholipase L1-like esterase
VLPLVVFAALLIAGELAVRALRPPYATRDFFLTLFGDPPDVTPKTQQPLFEGDPVRFWRLRPNVDHAIWDFTVVSTNAQGLRAAKEFGSKPPDVFRIVCLGDSITFGYRIPLVFPDAPEQYDRNDAAYPGRLERMLQAQYPGREVEVIALAVPGYSSHQGRLLLEDTIGWLSPDVVVICFGFNDVALKSFPDREVMSSAFVDTTLRRVMSSSQVLLQTWRWWNARPHAKTPLPSPAPRVSRADYGANILAMVALARAHGAGALVVGPVYRDRTTNPPEAARIALYRQSLRELMLAEKIPYLQVDELTEARQDDNRPLFGEVVHPSSDGHQLLAERVLEALRDQGLLAALASRDVAL